MVSSETMRSKSKPVLESHLGYWLRFVSNHVSAAFARKIEAHDIAIAEWVVLAELLESDLAPSVVAERIGMTRGAVTKLADKLIARKLVSREADAEDGRAQRLALTREGRALVPKLAALADANDAAFFGHLPAAERRRLEEAMKDIVRRRGLKTLPIA